MPMAVDDDKEEGTSLFRIPLDPPTLEKINACKNAGFPLCLRKSFVSLFKNESQVIESASRGGYLPSEIEGPNDVWSTYLKFLSGLSKEMGTDVVAVVESQVLKEIETLKCTECPIYEMELGVNQSRIMGRHC